MGGMEKSKNEETFQKKRLFVFDMTEDTIRLIASVL
jgi:hypothetical protein